MENLVFTQLSIPEVKQLFRQELESYFTVNNPFKQPASQDTDQWFNLSELCDYLPDKPAKATIYGYVSANTIPCHKGPKKLRFLKSEIDAWIKTGRNKTVSEMADDADSFLQTTKRKKQLA